MRPSKLFFYSDEIIRISEAQKIVKLILTRIVHKFDVSPGKGVLIMLKYFYKCYVYYITIPQYSKNIIFNLAQF